MAALTDEGFIAPRTADFSSTFRSTVESSGVAPDWESNEVWGNLDAWITPLLGELGEASQASYDARDVNNATGIHLDNAANLVGVERHDASLSTVTLLLQATKAVTIFLGDKVQDVVTLAFWVATEEVVFTAAGAKESVFQADTAGAVSAIAGDITKIVTPRDGWGAVANAADANQGVDRESDTSLRRRRAESVQAAGSTSQNSIRARMLAVDGVLAGLVLQNDLGVSQTIEGKTLDPHSIFVIAYPSTMNGDQQDALAQVLYDHSSAGIKMMGTDVTKTVTDIAGGSRPIAWDWATANPVTLGVVVTLDPRYDLATVTPQIEANVQAYFDSLLVGEDVRQLQLCIAAGTVDGVLSAVFTPGTDIPILATEVATLSSLTVT